MLEALGLIPNNRKAKQTCSIIYLSSTIQVNYVLGSPRRLLKYKASF